MNYFIKQKLRKWLKSHGKVPAVYQMLGRPISYKLERKEGACLWMSAVRWMYPSFVRHAALLDESSLLIPRGSEGGCWKGPQPKDGSAFISPVIALLRHSIYCCRAHASLFNTFVECKALRGTWVTSLVSSNKPMKHCNEPHCADGKLSGGEVEGLCPSPWLEGGRLVR